MTIKPILKPRKQDTNAEIYIQLSHQRKRALLSTGKIIPPGYWSASKCELIPSRVGKKQSADFKRFINGRIAILWEIWEQCEYSDTKQLKNHIAQHGYKIPPTMGGTIGYVEFASSVIAEMNFNNQRNNQTSLMWVKAFEPDIALNGWTVQKIRDFERFLRKQPSIQADSTVRNIIKRVGVILNKAIELEIIKLDDNPLRKGIKIKGGKPKDIKLELEQVKLLWDNRHVHYSIKVFLLSFLMDGMRFGDLCRIKWENLQGDVFTYKMGKTDKKKVITLTPQLKQLLSEIPQTGEYVLHQFNRDKNITVFEKKISSVNAYINKVLKKHAKVIGIEVPISMHVARHTFAYLAHKTGMDVIQLQQALNHSKVQTTREYIGRLEGDIAVDERTKLHEGLL